MSHRIPVQPVVVASGSGAMPWPLLHSKYPRQFLVLTSEKLTLYQDALRRVCAVANEALEVAAPITVGNDKHSFLLLDQAREGAPIMGPMLLEPTGRGTAPALTMAALQACDGGSDPVLMVAAADHVIPDRDACVRTMRQAIQVAASGAIVVLGARPTRTDTGCGYILGETDAQDGAARVVQFLERPDAATAARCVADGRYFCNSGMFALRASLWLAALERFRPDIARASRHAFEARSTDRHFVRPQAERFAAIPPESIERAVMERCPASDIPIRMVPLDVAWDDIGALDAVWNVAAKDAALRRKVHRPWGWYDSIDAGPRFQVKRIMVKPGASLSLQLHRHRAEHWIVVSGTAEVVNGEEMLMLSENERTYIPVGQKHRLSNPGEVPLEIIEVQSGSYLGEDDIVRFEDNYGRA